jgi:adenylate cyclase
MAAARAGTGHTQNVLFGHAIDPQFDRKEAVRLLRLGRTNKGEAVY